MASNAIAWTEEELKKMDSYVAMLMDGFPAVATDEMVADKNVGELKTMLHERMLKVSGKKSELKDRLLNTLPDRNKAKNVYGRNVRMNVMLCIRSHGDDGHGNKPPGMCRVEYWLAHLNPEDVKNGRLYDRFL
jgi:hypothetical protein